MFCIIVLYRVLLLYNLLTVSKEFHRERKSHNTQPDAAIVIKGMLLRNNREIIQSFLLLKLRKGKMSSLFNSIKKG